MIQHADNDTVASVVQCDTTMLRIPTRLEWIDRTAHYLRRRAEQCGACDPGRGERLLIALHEALTNAIVHGNLGISSALREVPGDGFARAVAERSADPAFAGRDVRVHFHFDGQRCDIRIADEGDGFDWQALFAAHDAQDPDAPPSLASSGRGVIIMRAFTDAVRYENGGREVVLSIAPPERTDRRADDRLTYAAGVRVTPLDADGAPAGNGHSAWEALTQDVSAGGIALIQSRGHTATRVLIELRDGVRPVYVTADVCRVTSVGEDLFQIGCRFAPAQDDGDGSVTPAVAPALLRLIERVEQQNAQPRRAHLRVGYTCPVEVRRNVGDAYRPAYSRDLSRGGMAFITSYELPCGPVEIRLPSTGGDAIPIRARVVRCQKVAGGVFDVGCEFA